MYECNVIIPTRRIVEIQDDGSDTLMVTLEDGESLELTADAFVTLTSREWSDVVTS